jgi:hypothetical protein
MNSMDSILKKQTSKKDWVRESRFGRWFLTTNIWFQYVLSEAIFDFKQLLKNRLLEHTVYWMLVVGRDWHLCSWNNTFNQKPS